MDFFTYQTLISLLTLTFLEIILGIDNLVFIALVVAKLPKKNRQIARVFGLSLAFVIRVLMLLTLSWVMTLTEPIFFIGEDGLSFKDFLLIAGGLFLMIKSGLEIYSDTAHGLHASKEEKQINFGKNMMAAILQISLIDFIFSFDSIITAVGMTNNIPVIIFAVVISMLLMLFALEKINHILQTYPSLKIVALAFIFMVGVILLADGIHMHISKGYLYFSLFFTLVVEYLNILARKRH
ncbi:MAG: TerC family protein [Proteobacteria bacterium]|nr:TerC family protein [Pseudomonadota bacterium]